jgi:hypothetical protein
MRRQYRSIPLTLSTSSMLIRKITRICNCSANCCTLANQTCSFHIPYSIRLLHTSASKCCYPRALGLISRCQENLAIRLFSIFGRFKVQESRRTKRRISTFRNTRPVRPSFKTRILSPSPALDPVGRTSILPSTAREWMTPSPCLSYMRTAGAIWASKDLPAKYSFSRTTSVPP